MIDGDAVIRELVLPAPAERVFDMFTDPRQLNRWVRSGSPERVTSVSGRARTARCWPSRAPALPDQSGRKLQNDDLDVAGPRTG